MNTKFIEEAIFFENNNHFYLREVADEEEFMEVYKWANQYFASIIGDINENGAELRIDMNKPHRVKLVKVDEDLKEILTKASLVAAPEYTGKTFYGE